MTKSTPERRALRSKRNLIAADLRLKYERGELTEDQIVQLEAIGFSWTPKRKAIAGISDLATLRPDLAAQWHPTRNGDLAPQDVTVKSSKKVWWVCERGHEWEAAISQRSDGTGCPYCIGKKVLPGYNDLATVKPELAAQWHPTKNGDLAPRDVIANSTKRVWWLGPCGHEWESVIRERARYGLGCPYCGGHKALPGYNDLATVKPELAAQWHPTKNGNLKPQDVTAGSAKKVWWLGFCGHEWESKINNRSNGSSCPYCANIRVLAGFNDLATTHPDIAAQWHPTKNGNLKPQDVMAGSVKRVWWQCEKGHEWESTINNRSCGSGCPYCANKRVLAGFNDLTITHPDIAAQWHPTKNGDLTPHDVMAGSTKRVWWRCEKGHEWETTVNNRSCGRGCPICARKKKDDRR